MAEPHNPDSEKLQGGFHLSLSNFQGPFDLLLRLIGNRKLDITEIALAQVTDEFIGYLQHQIELNTQEALEEASDFLVVAATLLDLKAARLLPAGEVEDEEDIAFLEAKDLLFARLLQYKAYKELAEHLNTLLQESATYIPRNVPLDPPFDALLPELVMRTSPQQLAQLAHNIFTCSEAPEPHVNIEHLHHPKVSVKERATHIMDTLRNTPECSFETLCPRTDEDWNEYVANVVATFLAVLELFRDRKINVIQQDSTSQIILQALEQETPHHA